MRVKNALKKFAYETFRPHSQEEYAELFSRGHGGDEKTPYPWFYARVFLISLLLFTILCVAYDASKINFLMVASVGAFFADITFIVLLVEIYPRRDLPLFTPVMVLFAGGILSSALIYILYAIANYNAPFADQAWTAFVEETGKAVTTIIILLIVKKRNPFACFIIGAAVGGGYSAFENMWFMYTHGFGWGELPWAIETGLWRALGTPFSHAAWAGAFGWALSFKKPWLKWQPYAVYAFNYTMHFFVNFPLMPQFAEWKGYPISAVTGVLSIILIIVIIVRCRRSLVVPCGQDEQTLLPQLTQAYGYPKINGYYMDDVQAEYMADMREIRYRFIANVLAAAAIFCFSFSLLGPTCVFGGYDDYKAYYYNDWPHALYVIQDGYEFEPDYDREYVEYNDLTDNFSYTWTNGELISVTQRDMNENDGYYYRYTYGYTTYYSTFEDENGDFFVSINGEDIPIESEDGELPESVRIWELKSVALEFDGYLYYPRTLYDYGSYSYTVYSADNSVPSEEATAYRYFLINPYVTFIDVREDGTFEVDLLDNIPVRMTESVVFSAVFFAAFAGCGIAYFVYKFKIRRLKNA